jgi:hypothetical protein
MTVTICFLFIYIFFIIDLRKEDPSKKKMMTILLLTFIVFVFLHQIKGDQQFIILTRIVTWMNNLRDKTPQEPIVGPNFIVSEYCKDGVLYGILVSSADHQNWTEVGAQLKDGTWIDATRDVVYHGGVFRNFHRIALKPKQINPNYTKLSFCFPNDAVIHVGADEVIVTALRNAMQDDKKKQ